MSLFLLSPEKTDMIQTAQSLEHLYISGNFRVWTAYGAKHNTQDKTASFLFIGKRSTFIFNTGMELEAELKMFWYGKIEGN